MAAKHTIQIAVLADTKNFSGAMRKLGNETGLSKLTSAAKVAAKAVAAVAVATTAAAVAAGVKFVGAAGDLEQSIGAVDSVFKGNAKQMHAWAKGAATSVGLTQNSYNELATLIGTQLKNGGTSFDEIAGKTDHLITLGADLASMFGGDTKTAVESISSALKGERDPIEKYGVSLKQATIDAKAAELGFKKVGGALSEEANQAATLALIMDQTTDSHGNFAKEANTLQGQTQRLKARFENFTTSLGMKLLPIVTKVVEWLADRLGPAMDWVYKIIDTHVTPALRGMVEWWKKNEGTIKAVAAHVGNVLAAALTTAVEWIGKAVEGAKNLWDFFKRNSDVLGPLLGSLGAFAAVIGVVVAAVALWNKTVAIYRAVTTAAQTATALFNASMLANPIVLVVAAVAALVAGLVLFFTKTETGRKMWESFTGFLTSSWEAVSGFFQSTWESITGFFSEAWDVIKAIWEWNPLDLLEPVWGGISDFFSGIWESITGFFTGMWESLSQLWTFNPLDLITGIWEAVSGFFSGIWESITGFFTTAWDLIKQVAGYHPLALIVNNWEKVTGFFSDIWDKIRGFFSKGWDLIKKFAGYHPLALIVNNWSTILAFFRQIPTFIKNVFSSAISWLKQAGSNVLSGLWNGLKAIWSTVSGWFSTLKGKITGTFSGAISWLKQAGSNVLSGLWNGLKDVWNKALTWLYKLPQSVVNTFSGAGKWLLNAGKNVMTGLWNGLTEIWNKVSGWFGKITSMIPRLKGPPAKDKTLLRGAGRLIMGGLHDGLRSEFSTIENDLTYLTNRFARADFGTLDAPGITGGGRAAVAGGINITVNTGVGDPLTIGREIRSILSQYDRLNGAGRR